MSGDDSIETLRRRLNFAAIFLPCQWLSLMAIYWIPYVPPLRPYAFKGAAPSAIGFIAGVVVSMVPFLLPIGWFRPRRFEKGGFYHILGIRWFRHVAPDGDLVNRRLRRIDPAYRVVTGRESLRDHLNHSIVNERWHTAFGIAGLLTSAHAFTTGRTIIGIGLTATNVAFNFYPVLHQRYKGARAGRLLHLVTERQHQ